MPIVDTTLYRTREEILAEMLAALQGAIPDVHVGEDGVIRIIFEIDAGQLENLHLANQLLLEDMFVQTASLQALKLHGEQYNFQMKEGTRSLGELTFEGDGGTYIPIGTEVGYDPGGDLDVIYFVTTVDGTVPNPGEPVAPTAVVDAAAGNLNGTYEYVVTFVTAAGETLPSDVSSAVLPASQRVDLSGLPLGGAGTTARRIYRDKNGSGVFRRVIEIADNTTTVYEDNIADATVAANPLVPEVDSAHRITVDGESQSVGTESNVAIGVITELVNAPATLTGVTNPTVFAGGSDQEDTEEYRQRFLEFLRNPQTGSPSDLKQWAEEVAGVETATVFTNDNMGTPTNGHVTIRISGPNGTVPGAEVIAAVATELTDRNIANIAIHVATFIAVPTNVTADVTPETGYVLADVSPQVVTAITDYINALEVGETLRVAGLVDAVFGLPGVQDVVITTPASNQTTAATDKRTPGTITVT